MNPFLRPDEMNHTGPRPDRTWGVGIFAPNDSKYFIPAADEVIGMAMARLSIPETILNDPATRIEFGNASSGWVVERIIKRGNSDPQVIDGPNAILRQ